MTKQPKRVLNTAAKEALLLRHASGETLALRGHDINCINLVILPSPWTDTIYGGKRAAGLGGGQGG